NPDDFLSALKSSGITNKVPVDMINTAPEGATGPENTFTSYTYYLYPAGAFSASGCPASYGPVYVLKIEHPGGSRLDESPGVTCGGVRVIGGGGTGTPYITGSSTN